MGERERERECEKRGQNTGLSSLQHTRTQTHTERQTERQAGRQTDGRTHNTIETRKSVTIRATNHCQMRAQTRAEATAHISEEKKRVEHGGSARTVRLAARAAARACDIRRRLCSAAMFESRRMSVTGSSAGGIPSCCVGLGVGCWG